MQKCYLIYETHLFTSVSVVKSFGADEIYARWFNHIRKTHDEKKKPASKKISIIITLMYNVYIINNSLATLVSGHFARYDRLQTRIADPDEFYNQFLTS